MQITVDKKRMDKKDIIILIPDWGFPEPAFNGFKKEIPKSFGYLNYHYTEDMLNSDPVLSKKYCLRLMKKMECDLRQLNKEQKRNFYIYAQSFGVIFAAYLADHIKIKKVVYVVPGKNLAESFWHGVHTQHLKKEMQKNKITLKKLKKIWKEISPDYHLKNKAKEAKYLVKLSTNDTIIPYKNGRKLIKLLKKRNLDLNYMKECYPI